MPIKVIDMPAEEAPTNDDYIIIRDNLTGTTRKITRTTFFLNPPLATGSITSDMLAAASVTKDKLAPDANPTVRTYSIANPSVLAVNVDSYEVFAVTSLSQSLAIGNPTGTPVNGQGILIRIKDNGANRAISYGTAYRSVGITAPTSTTANKVLYIAARFNSQDAKWDILSVGREA